jgi:hypothetical protein
MDQAHQQSSIPPHVNDDIMTAIIRSQYVHSVTLFLRSLPSTLTPAERLNLIAAIPQSVLDEQITQNTHALMSTTRTGPLTQNPQHETRLSQATKWLVFRLVLLFQFLLPFLRQFLTHAAQFEHEHHITKRAFTASVDFGSSFCRTCTRVIYEMNDGAVGVALTGATVYCAESISGGVRRGVADAIRVQEGGRRRKEVGGTGVR